MDIKIIAKKQKMAETLFTKKLKPILNKQDKSVPFESLQFNLTLNFPLRVLIN